ncbi:type I phosphomannose isomerase catalytic subunit [Winogradskyella sp. UBA3174]|uniref:type I phosphomannose isomerase catalytic subunit n=1 Tax=Winogradskyella sp. UBA3174 TaxID=1947785 RepID=UPI0025D35C5F|nr:type I phosphomannose isomerase catalytic subunit [Winogradskyella sp. UBA3174]|tara:strand:+ start:6735 stop:7706 length:972 start_codon:yes stop_codon:yes gene_type:complete
MKAALYPFKFQPILKDKIWGGEKLINKFNKNSDSRELGESWEVSTVPGSISLVSNGALKGTSLQALLNTYKSELLGTDNFKRFGKAFPLLIKFIDAKKDLSIQLHPNDDLAKTRHNSFGKTEMWYVMQADKDANLIVGFNQSVDKETYLHHLENKTLTKILNFDKVKEGDAYFIEAGRVHAIGAGVLLAEIQQTSDITYRIYDWDRVDSKGNERSLHNDIAIDAFDFNMKDDFRVNYKKSLNISNKMVSCPFFTTNYVDVKSKIEKKNTQDSFVVYMCVYGSIEITTDTSCEVISKGETILIPASVTNYSIQSEDAKLLEVYV